MTLLSKEWKPGIHLGLFILRVAVCLVLVYGHGWGKLSTIFGGKEIQFFDPIGLGTNLSYYMAGFAEGICSLLLLVGLFSRYAALILSINFMVIFYVHGIQSQDGFQELEIIYLYLFSFIALLCAGPGKISLDYALASRKR